MWRYTATVSYINKQGGVVSKTLNAEACTLYEWAIPRIPRLWTIHRPGVYKLAGYLSRRQGIGSPWLVIILIRS